MSKKTHSHNSNTIKNKISTNTELPTNGSVGTVPITNPEFQYSMTSSNTYNAVQNTDKKYHSATLNEISKYPMVKDTLNRLNNLPLFKKLYNQPLVISENIWKSNNFLQSNNFIQNIFQKILTFLTKLDNLLAILIFNKGIDNFIDTLNNKKNGTFGIWILWFFIDYLANCSNHILKELIMKPLNLSYNTKPPATSFSSDSTIDSNNTLPHLTELTSTTLNLSKDIQNKVHNDILEPTKDNIKKHFDLYIKPTVDQAKETYKTVSDKYEAKLKENDKSIPKTIYSTGLDIGNETIEKLNKFTHKNKVEISTTKD